MVTIITFSLVVEPYAGRQTMESGGGLLSCWDTRRRSSVYTAAHSNVINVLKGPALIEDDVVKQKLNTKINGFIRLFLQKPANCHCKVIKI